MQRPDLRQIAGNIREALGDCDRETLLDMLTFVFKEYVVEGPPPLLVSQAERIADLEGLSFPDLIRALQTRLDLPELNLFQVDGTQVSVRVGGVLTPLDASAARAQAALAAAAPAEPAPQPQQPPRPVAGVQVVETSFTRVPARVSAPEPEQRAPERTPERAPAAPAGQAPPPRRGLSVRGQPSGEESRPGAAAAREAQPGQAPPAQQGQPPQQQGGEPAQRDSGPRSERDSAAERFSLLELD
jgi:hypothetical protein